MSEKNNNPNDTPPPATGAGKTSERRSFFRINQDIVLDYSAVSADIAKGGDSTDLFPASRLTDLLSGLRRLDSESGQLLHSITENNRQIADYLSNLNKKLELLTQHILLGETQQQPVRTTSVNLSEGGIAFATNKPLYKGSFVALRMMFLPSYTSVVLFAQVIRSETTADDHHHLVAKFLRVQEAQAQVLSRQIMQAQLQAKRRQQASD
ncbi:PilZ domain-containing protein [Exilibacterium tricleocarpae]|uniref:PilZ domain-containing protein n=1 Tax=Exilibacterium tricleocarpae TaxID=2591008 RepID=A0A545TVT7_9GAMM|nr:PilZ domain-containing protein [Exilibacterium tricleocarpae]TQV81340.1 PilZ domain-containing protein [Exilibacterium tricleocarpae]